MNTSKRFEMLATLMEVEINQEFNIQWKNNKKVNSAYKITKEGILGKSIKTGEWYDVQTTVNDFMKANIIEIVTIRGKEYYFPDFINTVSVKIFNDDDMDKRIMKTVGVYPTKELALIKANELGW